ncbi:hypothetical protein C6P40_000767 [Pichia californica]|uniref:Uncharacterized protein n=1 Tax=Pichia californica TaxID=460514 RepID=A0A9P6WK62_9ASCO|nr:hypothetical protein C6P42_000843 [[Candida] californica]KAG0688585.1 hypothetical protein C6P40_000767 [[Candida] californica]
MGLIDNIKNKFHQDASNVNLMMYTKNNQQKFGLDSDSIPRNHMMDTISNEQGAEVLGFRNNENLQYPFKAINRNLMTHTISNEQAEILANGIDIKEVNSKPKNKLFDIKSNEEFSNCKKSSKPLTKVNSDRLL